MSEDTKKKMQAEAEASEEAKAESEVAEEETEAKSGSAQDEAAGEAWSEASEESSEETEETEASAEEESKEEEKADSEKYLRLLAEFQNFKKRSAKEKSDIHAYANEKIIMDLLPVLDNFERALGANAADDPEGYAKGMSLIFDQMHAAMKKAGLEEVEALGEDFDPKKHNAVMNQDSDEYESGKVSSVLQKGYTLNGKVIRPTMVAVSK